MVYLILVITAYVLHYFYQFYRKLKNYPPGPTPLPIIGNLHQLDFTRFCDQLHDWSVQYGPVFRINFPQPTIVITDFDLIKTALIKNSHAYNDRPTTPVLSLFSQGNIGLLCSNGSLWRQQRRFALHTLRNFGLGRTTMEPKILRATKKLLDELEKIESFTKFAELHVLPVVDKKPKRKRAGFKALSNLDWIIQIFWAMVSLQSVADTGKPYDPVLGLQVVVGNIIADVLFGHTFDTDERMELFFALKRRVEENERILASPGIRVFDICPWVQYVPWLGRWTGATIMKENIRQLMQMMKNEVDEHLRRMDADTDSAPPSDYLDAFIKQRKQQIKTLGHEGHFSIKQATASLLDLWGAGSESTVTTLRWAIWYLINNPEIQDKITNEIHEQIGMDRQVTLKDQTALPYCRAVIQEVQRCANIVPFNGGKQLSADTKLNGFQLKKGWMVAPQIGNVMWDEKVFPNAKQFKPERFIEHTVNGNKFIPSERVIPFSIGKRNCAGESMAKAELFLIFVAIMQKFRVRAVPGIELPTNIDENIPGAIRNPTHFDIIVESAI